MKRIKHGPTKRWHPAVLSSMQYDYLMSQYRINVVAAGRRSFKTEAAKRRVVRGALGFTKYPDGRFYACAPTQQQAKDIFWEDLKALIPKNMLLGSPRDSISDGELTIDLWNGAVIKVAGLDRPQRIEGKDWDGGVITEYGDCKSDVFKAHIRPMMTRGGWIDIEGVPEGRNHYFELVCDIREGKLPNAKFHCWTTEEVLHLWLGKEAAEAELEEARQNLDTLTYQQEYLGMFISFEGAAYYAFDDSLNVAPAGERVRYDPSQPLILCHDFNRQPGVALICQEQDPRKHPWCTTPTKRSDTVTCVIDEIYIARNSNTRKVATEIAERWASIHTGEVLVYGDASGGNKTSQGVDGSDWDIIFSILRPRFKGRMRDRVARSNPPVRARLNSVNSRLVSADGRVGTLIDRSCRYLIRDLEGCESDDEGNLVKDDDSQLTHISDAFGYYVAEKWGTESGFNPSFINH